MAVKRVISNKGKNTPGIDGVVWKTDKAKEDAILNITITRIRTSKTKEGVKKLESNADEIFGVEEAEC